MLLCLSAVAQAQSRFRHAVVDTVPHIVRVYTDSLLMYKHELDSIEASNDSLDDIFIPNTAYAPLFIPPTFYHSIAHNRFDLGSSDDGNEVDDVLLHLYFHRPDLVQSTQSQLDVIGTTLQPTPDKIHVNTDIVDEVAPEPTEPEAAPVDVTVWKPNFWNFAANLSIDFMQNYVSGNWYLGGQSSYTAKTILTLKANYNNKQRFKWDNTLEMRLGLMNARKDTVHTVRTSEDLLRYTGTVGLQAHKHWYYTFQAIVETQMLKGYNQNDPRVYSDIASPLKPKLSLGMEYTFSWLKGRLAGKVNFGLLAYSGVYCGRLALATRYGIDEGKHYKQDIGSQITANWVWKFTNNISWTSRTYFYTSYHRVEVELENTLAFQINRFLRTTIYVYPRYDDNRVRDAHHGYWMFREDMAMGFTFSF